MKKLLLSALAVLLSTAVAMADSVTFDFANNQYGQEVQTEGNTYFDEGTTLTEAPISLTFTKTATNTARFWQATSGVQLRVMTGCVMTVSINGGTISGIEFTAANTAMDKFTATPGTYTVATDKKSATWTGDAASVAFTASATIQLTKMVVTYTGGTVDTRKDAGLAFSAENVTLELGDAFTAPTLTKATTAPVTYASDKTIVATVDATTGAVTILAVGTARITASAEANEEYKAGSASYLITVKEKVVVPEGTVFQSLLGEGFSFANPEGLAVWKTNNYGLVGSAFANSATNAADVVAYTTDAIDLTSKKNVKLAFDQCFNNYKLNNVMIPVADFAGKYAFIVAREEGATEWTQVAEPTAPEAFSWTFYANAPVSLEAYAGKKVQIGFRYVSTAEVAGTWEIKNIFVTAENGSSALETIEAAEAPVEYYNLQGIRVANPEGGIFIRRQGDKVTKVIR